MSNVNGYFDPDLMADFEAACLKIPGPGSLYFCSICESELKNPGLHNLIYKRQNEYESFGLKEICPDCADDQIFGPYELALRIYADRISFRPGQHIGLTDLDGTEICEDSIYKINDDIYVVEYRPPNYILRSVWGTFQEIYEIKPGKASPWGRVIGNRWEPEYREVFPV